VGLMQLLAITEYTRTRFGETAPGRLLNPTWSLFARMR
jgi:hypothetical protein